MKLLGLSLVMLLGLSACDAPSTSDDTEHSEDALLVASEDSVGGPAYCADLAWKLTLRGCGRDAFAFEGACQHHMSITRPGCTDAWMDVAECVVLDAPTCGWEHDVCRALDALRREACYPEQ